MCLCRKVRSLERLVHCCGNMLLLRSDLLYRVNFFFLFWYKLITSLRTMSVGVGAVFTRAGLGTGGSRLCAAADRKQIMKWCDSTLPRRFVFEHESDEVCGEERSGDAPDPRRMRVSEISICPIGASELISVMDGAFFFSPYRSLFSFFFFF